jgi:hypothetical protein
MRNIKENSGVDCIYLPQNNCSTELFYGNVASGFIKGGTFLG